MKAVSTSTCLDKSKMECFDYFAMYTCRYRKQLYSYPSCFLRFLAPSNHGCSGVVAAVMRREAGKVVAERREEVMKEVCSCGCHWLFEKNHVHCMKWYNLFLVHGENQTRLGNVIPRFHVYRQTAA